jgi:hypothetical protein
MPGRGVLLAIAVVLAAFPAAVLAGAYTDPALAPPSQLLARAADARPPAAPASAPVLSHDGRIVRFAGFVSAASDIVPGSGSHANVYVVRRERPWGVDGTPWHIGPTSLVTRGLGGEPADGDSWSPAFSGNDFLAPRCLAFVSAASNLVAGDTDGRADVFVLGLTSGRLRRLEAPDTASAVSVDARCRTVAYVAGGTLYLRDRTGRTRRVSQPGDVADLQLSYNGKDLVYTRRGQVVFRRLGVGGRVIGPGAHPAADAFGRYVAFERDGTIYEADLPAGTPRAIATGIAPSMTSGGHFVFYGQGAFVRLNVKKRPVASCPEGHVVDTEGSPHGNYVAFTCSNGGVYLGYAGPRKGAPPRPAFP